MCPIGTAARRSKRTHPLTEEKRQENIAQAIYKHKHHFCTTLLYWVKVRTLESDAADLRPRIDGVG
jgi:hypothetical protein